jgi:quinoprotein glucose dehydrogenase
MMVMLATFAAGAAEVSFELVYSGLNLSKQRPVAATLCPDGSKRLFLVTQRGKIYILPQDRNAASAPVFLDFSDRKMEAHQFEEGLLGLAFHPQYKTNGKFYVYYSQQNPKRSVISEIKVSANDANKADLSTERVLLEIPQPFWNHNSGNMLFGKDGMLYIGSGDGGKANDLRRLAQNPWMLNGKILRIDVNSTGPGRQYGIPQDNPLVGKEGVREEIYATGIRNPWGMYEDPTTGLFWFADVGQKQQEEVNLLHKGGNYGWSYREGTVKFELRHDTPPDDVTFVEPIHIVPRDKGVSITGGVVYYGTRHAALKGYYIFSDWGTGTVWAIKADAGTGKVTDHQTIWKRPQGKKGQVFQPTAFVADGDGEILGLCWNGKIYEMK